MSTNLRRSLNTLTLKYKRGTRRRARKRGKNREKTNEPQPEEEADEEVEEPLPDIEPCMKRRKVTVPFIDEQEDNLVGWFKDEIFYNQSLKEFKTRRRD